MTGAASWHAIVVGAGPAGSTVATLLAQRGHRVLVLEKDAFPRFHIGESLLPASLPVLERLGVRPDADAFLYKRGAEFVHEPSARTSIFSFADALDGCPDHAWHVERAAFDTRLRDRALAAGADVRHGETVTDVAIERDRVRVTTPSGGETGRFVVDATGQDHLFGGLRSSIEPIRQFGATAVFTHFEGISDDALVQIGPGADIRIVLRDDGWGWLIPLAGRRLSVGLVSAGRVTPGVLDRGLLEGGLARRWTRGATRRATRVIRNFSYRNTVTRGSRFAVVGDAACFLDPVFSSGVTLALRGAEALADVLGPALDDGREADPDLWVAGSRSMARAYRTFAVLIDRFYNTRFASLVLLGDPHGMPLRRGVMSVLAGDVWRQDNPFQESLLSARRRVACDFT